VRAVLDPNVLISAVLSRSGTPAQLLRSWLSGEYELVVSPGLLDELGRSLSYPKITKRISAAEASELVDLLRHHAQLSADPGTGPSVRSTDPDDDYLIALAESTSAVLVSGDGDLQTLSGQIPVYSPAEFRALLDGVA
jgi:hypothetical protein